MYKSIRYHVRNLQPGATVTVDAGQVKGSLLRNYASVAAADFPGRKYKVHLDRTSNTYTVTRTA